MRDTNILSINFNFQFTKTRLLIYIAYYWTARRGCFSRPHQAADANIRVRDIYLLLLDTAGREKKIIKERDRRAAGAVLILICCGAIFGRTRSVSSNTGNTKDKLPGHRDLATQF